MNTNINEEFDSFLWLKAVPLKVNILMCRLFLNRLPTKDNVFRRGAIADTQLFFVALCGEFEDHNHVFFQCDVYGRLWLLVSNWLALVSAFHGNICHHAHQFCGLGGSSKKNLGMRSPLFGSQLYLLYGKITKEGFSTTSQIGLRLL